MPLLNGKLDIPNSEGPALSAGDADQSGKYFRVARTGEVFSSYEKYTLRIRQVSSRNWGSIRTGREGLSYEEAVLEDRDAEALIANVRKPSFDVPIAFKITRPKCLRQHPFTAAVSGE